MKVRMGWQRDELVALTAHYRISLADILFLTVRLFFRRQEISLLFNTYIGLYLQLLFLTKYVEIYAAEKLSSVLKTCVYIPNFFLFRKSSSCNFSSNSGFNQASTDGRLRLWRSGIIFCIVMQYSRYITLLPENKVPSPMK